MILRQADETTSHSTRLPKDDSQVAGYQDRRLIVGLTGGIGCGKSTVAALFAEHGAGVIDTDAIAHRLTQACPEPVEAACPEIGRRADGAAMAAIRAAFGDDYIAGDGALDRAKMRGLIFSDAAARQRLELILHPLILEQAKAQLRQLHTKPYIILVVPLLPASPAFRQLVQRVLVVDCDENTQVARVVGRSRMTGAEVRAVIAQQTPRSERLHLADDVLRNDAGLDSLAKQVAVLHERYSKPQKQPLTMQGYSIYRSQAISPNGVSGDNGVISYEFPLNEKIRTLLRLEGLFARMEHFTEHDHGMDHHAALITLFEILEVASRADLKSELLQELERQKRLLTALYNNPAISEQALEAILAEIDGASADLHAMTGKTGQRLRENEWLMGIKQRAVMPGGTCEFDLPSYHYWQQQDTGARRESLRTWLASFLPIYAGLKIVLRLLRESGKALRFTAHQGTFQQMQGGRIAQMLRVSLSSDLACIPEVGANKYAINIRFIAADYAAKSTLFEQDVPFELTFCNLA